MSTVRCEVAGKGCRKLRAKSQAGRQEQHAREIFVAPEEWRAIIPARSWWQIGLV